MIMCQNGNENINNEMYVDEFRNGKNILNLMNVCIVLLKIKNGTAQLNFETVSSPLYKKF